MATVGTTNGLPISSSFVVSPTSLHVPSSLQLGQPSVAQNRLWPTVVDANTPSPKFINPEVIHEVKAERILETMGAFQSLQNQIEPARQAPQTFSWNPSALNQFSRDESVWEKDWILGHVLFDEFNQAQI
jgi:hypothetical protein